MTTLREAAQQALCALQYHVEMTWPIDRTSEAIFNLRAALAQQQAGSWQDGVLEGHLRERERWLAQEQAEPKGGGRLPPPLQAEPVREPVAWRHKGAGHFTVNPLVSKFSEWAPLYTAPPQRKPLTEEEIERICEEYQSPRQLARAIERAHGIGGQP